MRISVELDLVSFGIQPGVFRIPKLLLYCAVSIPHPLEEIQKAISLLSTGKAPGGDSIPAEIYKELKS
jgi:hypothetical protein